MLIEKLTFKNSIIASLVVLILRHMKTTVTLLLAAETETKLYFTQ